MKAVVFHGLGDIRLDDVPEPKIEQPTDAIVRLTASAICGTDLHMIRGTMPGMVPGTILGHEGVGVVEEVGTSVLDIKPGDRVVVPSTICCGHCSYCTSGYHSQCDNANPNGKTAGTAFFGGPRTTGPIDGLQAEYARIPLAGPSLVKLPGGLTDDQAILISDIFPTGYFGADVAEIKPGDTVCVFGCGPVGLFAVVSARMLGAGRVFAVDTLPDRLAKARELGAETIDFNAEHPVEKMKELTGGVGVLRAIDAVGVDAYRPEDGPAYAESRAMRSRFKEEQNETEIAGSGATWGGQWVPGNAPSQVTTWAVQALAKAGTLSIIGGYPETMTRFPIGNAMMKNLTVQMGNCPHRKYIPRLIEAVASGKVDPLKVLTEVEPMTDAIEAYKAFDRRKSGWVKVELKPAATAAR
ncbi:Glutathione-independent formaldehyde dehydrogenase [Aquisphaera giovannonii]|uniref:Glutathione-independent formaldehyde dehydrogenase n=1 Tax=Aquisphaera giovannonii TaxID=406548 RepID=A0A5B9W3H1_9BACT|nr:zinc-dependent alcohol dehydrogenase [Aquisphaera giovannonii]QEH34784.1 Glutathione-independent formaldehyde dehydrogenase [Aquisphaera giovannonii]